MTSGFVRGQHCWGCSRGGCCAAFLAAGSKQLCQMQQESHERNRAKQEPHACTTTSLKASRPAKSTAAGSYLMHQAEKGTHRDPVAAERRGQRHPARPHPARPHPDRRRPAGLRGARHRAGTPRGRGPGTAAPAPASRSSCRSRGLRWSRASTAGQGDARATMAAGLLEPV